MKAIIAPLDMLVEYVVLDRPSGDELASSEHEQFEESQRDVLSVDQSRDVGAVDAHG